MLTEKGSPIYVATPSDAYDEIYEGTPWNRRSDLVLVGNVGLPIDDKFRRKNSTILVPHFSVLYENQWKGNAASTGRSSDNSNVNNNNDDNVSNDDSAIRVNTDPEVSPPTYIYGKHAATVSKLLEANGISTQIVDSFSQIEAYSGRKLLWASCFWLLCHCDLRKSNNKNANNNHHDNNRDKESDLPSLPLTVGRVHEVRQAELERLVDEILPSLRDWLGLAAAARESADPDGDETGGDETSLRRVVERIVERSAVLDYLRAYSESIPHAVPSVELAKREFPDRNGVWLAGTTNESREQAQPQPQPFHTELLEKLGVTVASIR